MRGLLATPTKVRVVGNAANEGASAKTKNWAIDMGPSGINKRPMTRKHISFVDYSFPIECLVT
jgi:hypothetical protein